MANRTDAPEVDPGATTKNARRLRSRCCSGDHNATQQYVASSRVRSRAAHATAALSLGERQAPEVAPPGGGARGRGDSASDGGSRMANARGSKAATEAAQRSSSTHGADRATHIGKEKFRLLGDIPWMCVEIATWLTPAAAFRVMSTSRWWRKAWERPEFGALCDRDLTYADRNARLRGLYPQLNAPKNMLRLLCRDPTRGAVAAIHQRRAATKKWWERAAEKISYEVELQNWWAAPGEAADHDHDAKDVDTTPIHYVGSARAADGTDVWLIRRALMLQHTRPDARLLIYAYRINPDTERVERALVALQLGSEGRVDRWAVPLTLRMPDWYARDREGPTGGDTRALYVLIRHLPGPDPRAQLTVWCGIPRPGRNAKGLSAELLAHAVSAGGHFDECGALPSHGGPARLGAR